MTNIEKIEEALIDLSTQAKNLTLIREIAKELDEVEVEGELYPGWYPPTLYIRNKHQEALKVLIKYKKEEEKISKTFLGSNSPSFCYEFSLFNGWRTFFEVKASTENCKLIRVEKQITSTQTVYELEGDCDPLMAQEV